MRTHYLFAVAGLALAIYATLSAHSAAAQAQGPTQNQEVHILVGRSIVVRTDPRLTRVLIGNPAVVSTTTTSPNEVVISAIAPGSSSVVLWQENNQQRILEVFADIDVALLRDAIQRGFPQEHIDVEAEQGNVMLVGTASNKDIADQIAKMAEPFSKQIVNSISVAAPGHRKEVLVKVRFAEVDRTKLNQFGVNFLSTGAANTPGTITTQEFGSFGLGTNGTVTGSIGQALQGFTSTLSVSNLLNIFLYRPDLNLGATISDLEQKNVIQILAEPDLLAADGAPATFLAGGELPYPIVSAFGSGQAAVSVQFKQFGVKLEFTPTIEDDNTIRLKVYPEVSALDYTNAVTLSGFTLPALTTRNATTVVELRDGQSFGIAGLLDQRITAQFSKMPGIGDIPILGELFKSHSINKTNTDLMVIVTPTIFDPAAAPLTGPEIPKMPIAPINQSQFDSKVPGSDRSK